MDQWHDGDVHFPLVGPREHDQVLALRADTLREFKETNMTPKRRES